jgi:hypothetical protein
MNSFVRILVFAATLTIANNLLELRGAEIKTTVVDALGGPLQGASIELRLTAKGADGKITNVHYLKLTTDRSGRAEGTYDEKVTTLDDVRVSLAGYTGYTTGLRPQYVLKKEFNAKDVRRAARLKGERQSAELMKLLSGDYQPISTYEGLDDLFFVHYPDIRSSLLELLTDPKVGTRAAGILRFIGNPDDLSVLAKNPPQVANSTFIEITPHPRSSTNLVEAAAAVAKALETKAGKWTGNKIPRLNDDETMALVDCEFVSDRCSFIYTATFHNIGDVWKLRSVRAISQALMALPPKRSHYVGVWHGTGDSQLIFARLQFNENGTGGLAISYLPNSPPQNYRITRWSLDGSELRTTVEPVDPEAEPIALENVRDRIDALHFNLVGKGWSREMTLLNAIEFERRAEAAKQKLDTLTSANK